MNRSSSKQEDERREEAAQTRISKVHGGQVVESIAPEDLESFNDADCKHLTFVRDPSETEFNAFVCSNPKCNEVIVYKKT